jgi:hypothetical protein
MNEQAALYKVFHEPSNTHFLDWLILTMKKQAFETSGTTYPTTHRNISEEWKLRASKLTRHSAVKLF